MYLVNKLVGTFPSDKSGQKTIYIMVTALNLKQILLGKGKIKMLQVLEVPLHFLRKRLYKIFGAC